MDFEKVAMAAAVLNSTGTTCTKTPMPTLNENSEPNDAYNVRHIRKLIMVMTVVLKCGALASTRATRQMTTTPRALKRIGLIMVRMTRMETKMISAM